MDLYSGTPWWIVKNPLEDYYNPLRGDISAYAVVIGSGITGALVADELVRRGIECVVVDKRTTSTGSTPASTALLQYEIDTPLCRLVDIVGEKNGVEAYRACLASIDDLERTFARAGVDCSFRRVPSLYYASSRRDKALINREYRIRKKYGLPVELLRRGVIHSGWGISAPAALLNRASARIDAYKAATGLMARNIRGGLSLYNHTEVTGLKRRGDLWFLRTACGHTIEARYVIVATGFEAGPFLPRSLVRLTTTFAIISAPVERAALWQDESLVWETADPYLYIRTDDAGGGAARIIVGGENQPFNNAMLRKLVIGKKAERLRKKFRRLMPQVPFETEFRWAGTFSSTSDGLPLIGPARGDSGLLLALGYGGNGITFSMVAAQVIAARLAGAKDPRQEIFSPARPSLK
ncbi:MAG: FAD-binding oxidoreductase [Alistipes sp.]|nr:FAD-binding oxidoreductase [Alistipes sp.]